MENTEIDPQTYGQLIINKDTKATQLGKKSFSDKWD